MSAMPGTKAERHAASVAAGLTVRSMFGSHQKFKLEFLHPMRAPEPSSTAAVLVRRTLKREGFSRCVPLIWVPVWAFSFAEMFINSVAPVDELQQAGLIDEHVLLRPDLNARPLGRYRFYEMLAALGAAPTRGLRDAAPKCQRDAARRARQGRSPPQCALQCYQRTLLCNFRSTFDRYAPPMAPWSAAQRVARRLLPRPPPPADEPPRHVLFVNRTRTRFSRSLVNLPQLLRQCEAAGARQCQAHEFGARGVAADVAAAQGAGVLVGTHGAGLVYGFYLPRGGALVEVRPYRFEGSWPDHYFKDLAAIERAPFYFQSSSGDAALSVPQPKPDVSVWDARDHGVHLPWRTLRRLLELVQWCGGSMERYSELVASGRNIVVSHAKGIGA